MSRYIDADGLKIEFMNLELDHCQGTDYREANQVIDDYPTADVQEIKHGRWIKPDYPINKLFHIPVDTECKNCGAFGNSGMNYCFHCGAKMDEVRV